MNESLRNVRVGVWGLGRHARRRILPALRASSKTSLVGVTTRDQVVAQEEADRYKCRVWVTPEDMLRDTDVDAIYISTPTGLHVSQGMMTLGAGKHLWCEKPLATTLLEAQQLSEASRRNGLALCEGLMYLYHPHFATVKQIVSAASFGAILGVRSQFGLPPLQQPGFRFNHELGGGALLDLAPYPLSAVLELFDRPMEVVESYVGGGENKYDVDLYGHALLSTVDDRVPAYLEWGYQRAYRNEISVWGEYGSIHSDFIFSKSVDHQPTVALRDKHGHMEEIEVAPADSFVLMFDAFSEVVFDEALREDSRQMISLRASYLQRLRS
jgi:NDP-hexose-3-ketoreductase